MVANGGKSYYYNDICTHLSYTDKSRCYDMFYYGAFSLDNSIGMFGMSGAYWPVVAWCRNSVLYGNYYDNGNCQETTYSDVPGCPSGTNYDVWPGFVGVGYVTEVGPGYIRDATAHWEPDRYRGYYVNPNVLGSEKLYYCVGNDANTLYVCGDPCLTSEAGDIYQFPDYRLRRVSGGYAMDSPLVDAGDPSWEYNDPDGSRCDVGAYGGPYSRTPLPVIPTFPPPETCTPSTPPPPATETPTATRTPRSTGTPTPTATPTAAIGSYVRLWMPSHYYHGGDPCGLKAEYCLSPSDGETGGRLFVALEYSGAYWFAPGWTSAPDSYAVIAGGPEELWVIPQFDWPAQSTDATGAQFIGALTDPGITRILGAWDTWEFGWEGERDVPSKYGNVSASLPTLLRGGTRLEIAVTNSF